MKKTTLYVILGVIALLLLAHYVFFADEWSAVFHKVYETIADFFGFLYWIFRSMIFWAVIVGIVYLIWPGPIKWIICSVRSRFAKKN